MERTITVKGVGAVSVKPDLIVLSFCLESKDMDYERSFSIATKQIEELRLALVNVGFKKEDLKTSDFRVDVAEKRVKDKDGDYNYVFDGYECKHILKLEFDLDTKLLGKVLSTISSLPVNPKISISFSVKNPNAVNVEILKKATENAKQKAEVLCESAGVKLGSLVTIDYNWGEVNVVSSTRCVGLREECSPPVMGAVMDIEPEDIDAEDTATFVWEII